MDESYLISFRHALGVCESKCSEKKDLLLNSAKAFVNEINEISDQEILNFTLEALDNAPYQFWLDAASITGKHHAPEDLDVSGTIRHSIKSICIAKSLLRPFGLDDDLETSKTKNDYYKNLAISAAGLHDILKNGMPWGERMDYRHGILAYNWLEQFTLNKKEAKDEIRSAIRYHMWKWCEVAGKSPDPTLEENKREIARAINASPLERVVQLADYFSGRRQPSFMPGIDITDSPKFIEKYGKIERKD